MTILLNLVSERNYSHIYIWSMGKNSSLSLKTGMEISPVLFSGSVTMGSQFDGYGS